MNKSNIITNVLSLIIVTVVAITPSLKEVIRYVDKRSYDEIWLVIAIIVISWLTGIFIEYTVTTFILKSFNITVRMRFVLKSIFSIIVLQSIFYLIRVTVMSV